MVLFAVEQFFEQGGVFRAEGAVGPKGFELMMAKAGILGVGEGPYDVPGAETGEHHGGIKAQRAPQGPSWGVCGGVVGSEIVEEYVYLGVAMTRYLDQGIMAEKRLDKARKAAFLLKPLLRDKHIPVGVRATVLQAVVSASLLYGSELWGMNAERCEKGQVVLNDAMRMMPRPGSMVRREALFELSWWIERAFGLKKGSRICIRVELSGLAASAAGSPSACCVQANSRRFMMCGRRRRLGGHGRGSSSHLSQDVDWSAVCE